MVAAPSHSELTIAAVGVTDSGPQRQHNEDAVLLRPDLHLYAVADGAGGPNAGNVASAVGLMTLATYVESSRANAASRPAIDELGLYVGARRLSIALHRANKEVVTLAKRATRTMGSTVCAALFDVSLSLVHLAHVGDSRCYRFRGELLEALTVDHSLLQDVLEAHPESDDSYLKQVKVDFATRALGTRTFRVALSSHEVLPGDVYLLCSDGLRRALGDRAIRQVLALRASPRDSCAHLIRKAYSANADDNVAALVITCDLAPGSDPALRPRPPPLPPYPERADAPEILTADNLEVGQGADTETDLQVLPPQSASPELMQAMGTLISNQHAWRRTVRLGSCHLCHSQIELQDRFCPHCGAKRPG